MEQYYELKSIYFEGINVYSSQSPNENLPSFSDWLNIKTNNDNQEPTSIFFKYIIVDSNNSTETYYVDKNTLLVYDDTKQNKIGSFNLSNNKIIKLNQNMN